ncbi:MAG: helix-turn-helix domain-containing protein [Acidimicrobiales bacterium]
MDENKLGQYLMRARQEAGLSVRGLARLAQVDWSWLSKVERGVYKIPDPRYLYRLARALNLEPADLFLEAGFGDSRGLPGFVPYLRAKYHLPPDAIDQLDAHFRLISAKYVHEDDAA